MPRDSLARSARAAPARRHPARGDPRRAGASSSAPAAPASRSTRCATSGNRSSGKQGYALARSPRPRGADGHPGRGQHRRCPAPDGRRRRARRDRPRAAGARSRRPRDGADVVVMAAAVGRLPAGATTPSTKIKKTRTTRRTPTPRPRSSWCATPTSSPAWSRRAAQRRRSPVDRRLRRRDRRRRPAACSTTPGPSWPARAATCWSSTRSGVDKTFGQDDNDRAHPAPRRVRRTSDRRRPGLQGRRRGRGVGRRPGACLASPDQTRRAQPPSPSPQPLHRRRPHVSARLFTSESVTEGHPDKICDQISDSILDAMLDAGPAQPRRRRDDGHDRPGARRRRGDHRGLRRDPEHRARHRRSSIGYDSLDQGLRRRAPAASRSRSASSPPTSPRASTPRYENRTGGVDPLDKQGAGDQGLMFGYACDDTAELMPLPIYLAHRLAERLTAGAQERRAAPTCAPTARPRSPSRYDGDRAVRLDTVVLSTQHAADVSLERHARARHPPAHVIEPVLAELRRRRHRPRHQRLPRADQPHRPLRDRRPDGRRRPHRPQDHRRHLRRHGPPRRRRLLRQGPDQGRPLGRLRDALGRQERRRRRAGPPLRGAGRLRHRQGPAGRPLRRDVRHRDRARRQDPGRDHRRSSTCARPRSSTTLDLLRPIYQPTAAYGHFGRTQRRRRRERLHLGAHRPRRGAAGGRQG